MIIGRQAWGLGKTAGIIAIFNRFHTIASEGTGGDRRVRDLVGRRTWSVGRRTGRDPRRTGSTDDAPSVEVVANDPRRGQQVRVAQDRRGHPIHVRGLECRDLAEGVAMELAERHLRCTCRRETRLARRLEAVDAGSHERTVRIRGAARPHLGRPRADRRLARWMARPPGVARRRVARMEDIGGIEAGGHRSGGPGRRRPRRAPFRGRPCAGRPARARSVGQLLVRGVDLGHPLCGRAGRRRVAARPIRMVFPGEATPGGLDRAGRGAGLQPEDDVGLSPGHRTKSSRERLTGRPGWRPLGWCPPSVASVSSPG
jgi:hypothetical protein